MQELYGESPTLRNLDPTGYRNVGTSATLKKNTLVVKPPLLSVFLSFSFRPPPPPRPPNPLVRLVVQLSFEDNRSSPSSLARSRFLPRTFRPHLTQAARRRRWRRVMQSGGGGAVITATATGERNSGQSAKNAALQLWRVSANVPA